MIIDMRKETINPACSHCGYEFDDEETWYPDRINIGEASCGDGDDSELKCPSCGETFYVRCVHHIRWYAIDEDGDEILT